MDEVMRYEEFSIVYNLRILTNFEHATPMP